LQWTSRRGGLERGSNPILERLGQQKTLEGGGVIADGGSRKTWRVVTSRKIWRGSGVIGPPFLFAGLFFKQRRNKRFQSCGLRQDFSGLTQKKTIYLVSRRMAACYRAPLPHVRFLIIGYVGRLVMTRQCRANLDQWVIC
jgi:hypothetical protein